MKRLLVLLCFLLLAAGCSAAAAETVAAFSPENPRVGDYVDVAVTPGREDPQEISWELFIGEEKSITYKPVSKDPDNGRHLTASFRPRQEGEYTLRVTVSWGKEDTETVEITVPVSGFAPAQENPDVVYSQKDGWWYKKKYSSKRDLQKAGCAIFALSHALQRMGISDAAVVPDALAKTYSYYYVEGRGTYNAGLIGKAAADYDFLTQKDLLTTEKEIADSLRRGDLLSFSIVDGHIALADGVSGDGTKVHVVDSAPGATYERITSPESIFILSGDGTYTEAAAPSLLPGIRWFFETREYGGTDYWMDIGYCARRGMRLIRQQWLKAETEEGLRGVSVEYVGALVTKVVRDKAAWRVPTRNLVISGRDAHAPRIAMVTAKKGTYLKDGNGRRITGKNVIRRNYMVLLLSGDEDSYYAWWDDAFGYLTPEDVTVLPAAPESFATGVIISGRATVHLNPDKKSTGLAEWKKDTPVAVADKQDSYYLVEGKGFRGWVHEKYIQLDKSEENDAKDTEGSSKDGQKIDEGK